MNDTIVTIRGWIGGTPKTFANARNDETGAELSRPTTLFRVGVTPRYYSRLRSRYEDGATTWYAVRCYGALAKNTAGCLLKGMPVMVRGKLVTRVYADKEGEARTELLIMADSVGVELSTGVVTFAKSIQYPIDTLPGEPGAHGGSSEGGEGTVDVVPEDSEVPGPEAEYAEVTTGEGADLARI